MEPALTPVRKASQDMRILRADRDYRVAGEDHRQRNRRVQLPVARLLTGRYVHEKHTVMVVDIYTRALVKVEGGAARLHRQVKAHRDLTQLVVCRVDQLYPALLVVREGVDRHYSVVLVFDVVFYHDAAPPFGVFGFSRLSGIGRGYVR